MITSRDLLSSMGAPPTLSQFRGEVKELLVEVRSLNFKGIKDESSDVAWFFWALMAREGINLPAIGAERAWQKYQARVSWWKKFLADRGLKFHPSLLAEGSNYHRKEKRERILAAARLLKV